MQVHIEFYGIPRQRTGTAAVTLEFPDDTVSLGSIVGELKSRFSELAASCFAGNSLQHGYAANLNGEQFLMGDETIPDRATVLILSADAGG